MTRIHRVSGWSPALQAYRTSGIRVRNCVLLGGIGAVEAAQCPDLRFENNVAYGNMISHIRIDNGPHEPFTLAGNIFAETGRGKQHVAMLGVWQVRSMTEKNNCFYLRWPESERMIFEIYELSQAERRIDPLFDVHTKEYFFDTLPAYHAVVGPTDSFVANPCWPGGRGFAQGWPSVRANDFADLFTANPELVLRGIGLQPEAFADFHFAAERGAWPFDRPWAQAMLTAQRRADALAADGKDPEALDAYLRAAEMPAPDRLKSALLEAAALCAQRMGRIDRALEIAERIPETFLALRNACRMRILLEDGRYAQLIETFADTPGGGNPLQHWNYPELDDLLVRIYHMRAIAYAELGDLEAAEADLKTTIDAQARIGLYSAAVVQDLAWLKLGDFYRDYLKDDDKALEAFLRAADRTRPRTHGPVPVLNAVDGVLAEAAEAAAAILRRQGRETEACRVRFDALFAQGNALGLLDRKAEAVARFGEALTIEGISDEQREDCERRIAALQNGRR